MPKSAALGRAQATASAMRAIGVANQLSIA
jgi:hypothetical protein